MHGGVGAAHVQEGGGVSAAADVCAAVDVKHAQRCDTTPTHLQLLLQARPGGCALLPRLCGSCC
jgi:hypothetical protein